jgi:hypothetical protein
MASDYFVLLSCCYHECVQFMGLLVCRFVFGSVCGSFKWFFLSGSTLLVDGQCGYACMVRISVLNVV